jgi:hypothetical protein
MRLWTVVLRAKQDRGVGWACSAASDHGVPAVIAAFLVLIASELVGEVVRNAFDLPVPGPVIWCDYHKFPADPRNQRIVAGRAVR